MSWQDTLAVVPWSSFPTPDSPSPNLLVKVALSRGSAPGLVVLATPDLVKVYCEDVNQRNLVKRIGHALNESQETQSQQQGAFGAGDEGHCERELRERLEEVIKGIREGEAEVKLDTRGSEAILTVSLPSSFTIQFVLDSLDDGSGPFLASQLITPLLGLSTSLVGLLKEESSAQPDLLSKVQDALDATGTAEYNQEGRACNTLLRNGGGGMMQRWAQRSRRGQKAKELDSISFSGSSSSFSRPAPTLQPGITASASTSLRRRSPSPPPAAPRPSASPSKSLARQILDHKHPTTQGETISWEESQAPAPAPRSPKKPSGWSPAKGKGKAGFLVLGAQEDVEDEEEPATEEDEPMVDASPAFESAPTAAQPPSTKKRPAASMDRSSDSPPPRHSSHLSRSRSPSRSPSPSQSQTEKQDSDDDDDEEDEEAQLKREKARVREKKRLEKEKEEREEKELRSRRMQIAAKQAARKGAPAVKKRRD